MWIFCATNPVKTTKGEKKSSNIQRYTPGTFILHSVLQTLSAAQAPWGLAQYHGQPIISEAVHPSRTERFSGIGKQSANLYFCWPADSPILCHSIRPLTAPQMRFLCFSAGRDSWQRCHNSGAEFLFY